MTFLDFIMFLLDVILHTPLTSPLLSSVQTFRLRLLHIKCSDFAFICIRCSDFICITFASTADQTFRLRLLRIKRSNFVFIWIRCLDFICITFASTADQMFRLRVMPQISGVLLTTRQPAETCGYRVPRYHTHMSHISRPIPAYLIHNIQKYIIDYNQQSLYNPFNTKRYTCFSSARI